MERLRVVTCNTHVGQAIHSGGLAWLVRETEPDIVLLAEVQRRGAKQAARRALPAGKWLMFGPPMSSNAGTYIFEARDQFKRVRTIDRRISAGRSGFWPTRNLDVAVAIHKPTGRKVHAASVHAWALLRDSLTDHNPIVIGHRTQIATVANYHGRAGAANPQSVQLCGGDFNERLDGFGMNEAERQLSAVAQLAERAKMRPAYRTATHGDDKVRLDDVFVRTAPFVTVVRRQVIEDLPGRGDDHWSVVVDLDIAPLNTQEK